MIPSRRGGLGYKEIRSNARLDREFTALVENQIKVTIRYVGFVKFALREAHASEQVAIRAFTT